MKPDRTPKLGQSDLLYGSKSPPKKVGMNRHFQASWASQPMWCLYRILFSSCVYQLWSYL